METKQTAVNWLIENLTESGHLWLTDKSDDMNELNLIIEKAKEKEAIHLYETYEKGFNKCYERLDIKKRDYYARLYLKEFFNIKFFEIIKSIKLRK